VRPLREAGDTALGWQTNIFPLLIITSGSGFTGLFIYSPGPGKGNLIASFAAQAGTDPYGNAYATGFNIGIWSAVTGSQAQHFGIDNQGRVYIVGPDGVTRVQINNGTAGVGPDIRFFNDFGAVILVVDPNAGGVFQYQDLGSAAQGVLVGAFLSKNAIDPVLGGSVGAGINVIDPAFGDSLAVVGANVSFRQALFTSNAIQTANTGAGATRPFFHAAAPEQGHAGHAVQRWYGTSADGTVAGGSVISLTDPPVPVVPGALLEVQGRLALTEIAVPVAAGAPQLFGNTGGNVGAVSDTTSGDGNTYDVGHLILRLAASVSINSAVSQVPIFSKHLGVGFYDVEIWAVTLNATAADAAQFSFAFTGTATSVLLNYLNVQTGAADDIVTCIAAASLATVFNGQGVAGNQLLKVDLSITVSVAGTLTFQGIELVAGNAVTVFAGSKMRIRPVNAT
jgi:hypothetical protein